MIEDYSKAKKRGLAECRKAISEGRYPYLLSLDSIVPHAVALPQEPLGIKEIPLSMIAGTVTDGRTNSFSCGFMPILGEKTEFATKWSNLYDSAKNEGIHDPIICFEYLHRFYVQEGNKRVSVTKYNGGYSLSGDVRRLRPPKTDDPEILAYYEFLDFYDVTGVFDIVLENEGDYLKLAEFYGQDLKEKWPEEVVETLHQDYSDFSKAYDARHGSSLPISAGEAFLKYLTIYTPDSFREDTSAEIGRKIGKIWNEFLTAANENAIIETPADVAKSAPAQVLDTLLGRTYSAEHPLRVAFIYASNAADSSWAYGHELGRNEIEAEYKGVVETIKFENCRTEEEIDRAFDVAAVDEDEVVITTSEAMMDASLRAAVRYPSMKILNCSINLASSAVRSFYPKMYEAKFLMGALAASMTHSGKIGYLADSPIYGNIANINAFAIGAALIDPDVKIFLKWSGVEGEDWERKFRDLGVNVISGMDFIRPKSASRKYGLYYMDNDGTALNIAAPILHWGAYYKLIIDSILDGTWKSRETVKKSQTLNYWYGLKAGVIDVILSQNLNYYSEKLISHLRDDVIRGSFEIFGGEIHSQDGVIRKAGDSPLTSEEIIKMNWLNDNVEGRIPVKSEMKEAARETVAVSGVSGTGKSQE